MILCASSACAHAPPPAPRGDIVVVEAGDATITRIDGAPIRAGNNAAFQLRPGGHTVEISDVWVRPDFGILPIRVSRLATLCLKAKPGRRYRIKSTKIDGRMRVLFIDTSTGEPPRTPCGPDEDDD